jgi:hypothetical protein
MAAPRVARLSPNVRAGPWRTSSQNLKGWALGPCRDVTIVRARRHQHQAPSPQDCMSGSTFLFPSSPGVVSGAFRFPASMTFL